MSRAPGKGLNSLDSLMEVKASLEKARRLGVQKLSFII
jgi:hypothetical protein